ncbi:MAG TPA: head GIN domain-containing protein [Flavihumibacter sp.]|nr:head GIN domain-containing protein [Flavihumibacter sp.]
MKRIGLFACLLLLITAVQAQSVTVNDANARKRDVGAFTGVKVSQGIELLLQQGNEDAVAVSSSRAEYQDRIKTEVTGGVLRISIEDRNYSSNWRKGVKFRAYVSVRQLEKLIVSSGASARTGNVISVARLELDASSGGTIDGEFKGQRIESDNSSGSVTTVKGSVDFVSVKASSGSIFKGFDLSAVNGNVDASSGGSISVTVTKEMDAEATSGGDVKYRGGAVIRNMRTSSGGSVRSNS